MFIDIIIINNQTHYINDYLILNNFCYLKEKNRFHNFKPSVKEFFYFIKYIIIRHFLISFVYKNI